MLECMWLYQSTKIDYTKRLPKFTIWELKIPVVKNLFVSHPVFNFLKYSMIFTIMIQ